MRTITPYILSIVIALSGVAASPQSTSSSATPAPPTSRAQGPSLADSARQSRKNQRTHSRAQTAHKTKVFTNDSFNGHGKPQPEKATTSRHTRKSHAKTAKKKRDPFKTTRG